MKSLIATAALSLLALSTIAEAQPQKNQSTVETHLMASLPIQDVEFAVSAPKSSITVQFLLTSLPTFDANVEMPALQVNVANLMASLPTFDANAEIPASRINSSKLMASLPTMDETTVTSILVDTDVKHLDTKNHQTVSRLSEE